MAHRKFVAVVATKGYAHSPLASTERLYLPRDGAGRELISVVRMWEREVVGSATYLMHNADNQVQGALRCMRALEEVHLRVTP